MKICTACSASYSDESLRFCPVDGTTLTPQKEISLDQVPFSYEAGSWSDAETPKSSPTDSFTNPEPPPTAAFSVPPAAPQNYSSAPAGRSNGGSIFPTVVAGLAIVAFAGVVLFLISGGSSRREPEARTTTGGGITLANGTSVKAEPVGSPMSTTGGGNTAVVSNAPAANGASASNSAALNNAAVKPISRKTDFTGIWKGEFNEEPTILSITTQNGDGFSGTLSKKGYIIKITGKVDFEKGSVNIKETAVLQTPPNLKWNLGNNDGTVSGGGKSMSGTGSDKNGYYEWSFTKD